MPMERTDEVRFAAGDICQAMFTEKAKTANTTARDGISVYAARSAPGANLLFTDIPNSGAGWSIGAFESLTKVGRYEADQYSNHPAK